MIQAAATSPIQTAALPNFYKKELLYALNSVAKIFGMAQLLRRYTSLIGLYNHNVWLSDKHLRICYKWISTFFQGTILNDVFTKK